MRKCASLFSLVLLLCALSGHAHAQTHDLQDPAVWVVSPGVRLGVLLGGASGVQLGVELSYFNSTDNYGYVGSLDYRFGAARLSLHAGVEFGPLEIGPSFLVAFTGSARSLNGALDVSGTLGVPINDLTILYGQYLQSYPIHEPSNSAVSLLLKTYPIKIWRNPLDFRLGF